MKLVLLTLVLFLGGCASLEKLVGKTVAGDHEVVCTFAHKNKIIAVVETKGSCKQLPDGTLGGCHVDSPDMEVKK